MGVSADSLPTVVRAGEDQGGVLRALVDMQRAASAPTSMSSILSTIAATLEEPSGAHVSIVILDERHRVDATGGRTVTADDGEIFAGLASGRAGKDRARREVLVVPDIETDARLERWHSGFREAGYRSVCVLPLGARSTGVLIVSASTTRVWTEREVNVLELIAEHVAAAVRSAQLLHEQKLRLTAHTLLLRGLREQTLDHRARLEALQRQLELDDDAGVAELVADFETQLNQTYAVALRQIRPPVIAGLVWGETSIARQKGVTLRLDGRSSLTELPARLRETEAVSIIGNLLQNAFDAVAGLPASRRRVTLLISESTHSLLIRVRDWGVGLSEETVPDLLEYGVSTKPGHDGVGLAVVAAIATAAGGHVKVEPRTIGTAFDVVIPRD